MKIRALLCLFAVLSTTACGGSGGGGPRPPPTIAELTAETGTYSAHWTCPSEEAWAPASFGVDLALRLSLRYPSCGTDVGGIGECVYDEATGAFWAEVVSLTSPVTIRVEGNVVHDGRPGGPFRVDATYTCEPACGPYEHGALVLRGPIPNMPPAEQPASMRPRGWIYADGEFVGTLLSR